MNYKVCEKCINNPKNNKYASGICCCMLPYMDSTSDDVDYVMDTKTDVVVDFSSMSPTNHITYTIGGTNGKHI